MPLRGRLTGRRVLIVEDEFLIADSLAEDFQSCGATVAGPAATVTQALDLLSRGDRIDAAVLDVKLLNEWVYPVAEALRARGVPFAFATGYDGSAIDSRFAAVPRLEKPVELDRAVRALFG